MSSRLKTGFAFISIGAVLFAFTFLRARAYHRERSTPWVEVPLTFIATHVVFRDPPRRMSYYEVQAEYGYEFAGTSYRGTTVWLDGLKTHTSFQWDAEAISKSLERQKKVFVDSSFPASSVLFREGIEATDFSYSQKVIRFFGVVLLLIGGWLVVPRRRKRLYHD